MGNWGECSECNGSIVIPTGEKGDSGSPLQDASVVSGSSTTLTSGQSGSLVVFDRAAGSDVTLPTTPPVGTYYDFTVKTSVTSNDYSVNLGSAAENFGGYVFGMKAGDYPAIFTPSALGTSAISMNGTTTGGLIGTSFRVAYTETNLWTVSGSTYGSGSLATPFS